MPYEMQIDRANPGCIIFMVDQSNSMLDGIAGTPRPKLDTVATAINRFFANGFRGVLNKIEENLDQLISRAEHVRQGGIVDLAEAYVPGEPGLSEALHVVEDSVDVEALPLPRGRHREGLHPVDEFHDAVRLVTDEPGQGPVLVADAALKQLRRAANSGQRIFDLMREHCAQRSD